MIKFASYVFFKESHLSLCLDLNVLQRYFSRHELAMKAGRWDFDSDIMQIRLEKLQS